MRVGIGYDVHPLKLGRELILGGVRIDHGAGLDGHSDALKTRDAVEVEVVGHDRPALALGGAHEVRVDLRARRRIVLLHLQIDGWVFLHLGQHV